MRRPIRPPPLGRAGWPRSSRPATTRRRRSTWIRMRSPTWDSLEARRAGEHGDPPVVPEPTNGVRW